MGQEEPQKPGLQWLCHKEPWQPKPIRKLMRSRFPKHKRKEKASFAFFHLAFSKKKTKNSGYLPKRTPFVMSPTTCSCVQRKSRHPVVALTSSKTQLSPPWTGTRCGRDMVPNGPTHQRHPTQLRSKWTAALSLSTDSLPKLTVAVRMKMAVSQLQRL